MEKAPSISWDNLTKAMLKLQQDSELAAAVSRLNDQYIYWDKAKYKQVSGIDSEKELWALMMAERVKRRVPVPLWKRYGIHFSLTNQMQRQCHQFDMDFGGSWMDDSVGSEANKERYLISSLIEEAISSSQMEGAVTTRKVAKEMLRKKLSPKDKSQRMIFNNYQTIRFIVENKHQPLSEELLLEIHRLMTIGTLENPDDVGRFRQNDEVVVQNQITGEVAHTPPTFTEIPAFVSELCQFFNENDTETYIHPVIKGVIIHFMVAYMHPFVDGNGRTARVLFYWYMLKQGYWLTEYLSISRIIYAAKPSYEKSFLYAETDQNDIGYFIAYNLRVIELAFKGLQDYIKRKQQEQQAAHKYLQIPNLNMRQAEIVKMFEDNPHEMIVVKDLQVKFLITPTTAKADILPLLEMGLLKEIALNKVKKAYLKGDEFDKILSSI